MLSRCPHTHAALAVTPGSETLGAGGARELSCCTSCVKHDVWSMALPAQSMLALLAP